MGRRKLTEDGLDFSILRDDAQMFCLAEFRPAFTVGEDLADSVQQCWFQMSSFSGIKSTKFILILNRIKQGGAHYLRQKRTKRKKETKNQRKKKKGENIGIKSNFCHQYYV